MLEDDTRRSFRGALVEHLVAMREIGAIFAVSAESAIDLSLFFECADASEVEQRWRPEALITQVEVRVA